MAQHTVDAQIRSEFGNGPSRRLRSNGLVPGVLYRADGEALPIALDAHELTRILFSADGRTSVIALSIAGGASEPAVLADWQLDPVRSEVLHVDFRPADDVEIATGVVEREAEHIEIVTYTPRDEPEEPETGEISAEVELVGGAGEAGSED